ncbi:MAG: DUF2508 family protein [Vulcanibacillus sp.]
MLLYFLKKKLINDNTIYKNILKEVARAKKDWEQAHNRFNEVNDPDAIDYVIYYIIAAERRYMYLINKNK